jgi:peptidoglycan/xylan/chitin deacetylase (PgdA/CDA1 family)
MPIQRPAGLLAPLLLSMVFLAGAATAEPVALTFDDLPTMALDESPAYARLTNQRLLAGLRRHHLPAIGFVIGRQLEDAGRAPGEAILQTWLDAGFQLGNHTWSHESLNKTPVGEYIADVKQDDDLLRALLTARGQTPRWFRHPYLDTGDSLLTKHTFEAWLQRNGYRVAPVTMENSDYLFSPPYDDALRRHDLKAQARVRHAYLAYTAKTVAWYRRAGRELLGRRPAFVFLLHDTRLNADALDGLVAILRADHLRAVTLDQAMTDPAYRLSDDYVDPDGDEWLSRWSHIMGRDLPWDDFPEPPADIAAESERLDPS